MKCPVCDHTESKVLETVNGSRIEEYTGSRANMKPVNAIRRQRRCANEKCDHRFITFEVVEQLIDISTLSTEDDDDLVG